MLKREDAKQIDEEGLIRAKKCVGFDFEDVEMLRRAEFLCGNSNSIKWYVGKRKIVFVWLVF